MIFFLCETDEEDALSSLARSKISSKFGLDEKFEALQHAEEAYYQSKVQKKVGYCLAIFTFTKIAVGFSFLKFNNQQSRNLTLYSLFF